jgi:hypothetical protein
MATVLRELTTLLLGLVATVGSISLALGLLNRRDRRRAVLIDRVCAELPASLVRSDLEVEAGAALVSRGGWVRVDLGPRPPSETWAVIMRLRRVLPRNVRLTVDGWLAERQPARLTIESLEEPSTFPRAA